MLAFRMTPAAVPVRLFQPQSGCNKPLLLVLTFCRFCVCSDLSLLPWLQEEITLRLTLSPFGD